MNPLELHVANLYSCFSDIDDCVKHECEEGSCVDGQTSYRCDCFQGYTGQFCHKGETMLTLITENIIDATVAGLCGGTAMPNMKIIMVKHAIQN